MPAPSRPPTTPDPSSEQARDGSLAAAAAGAAAVGPAAVGGSAIGAGALGAAALTPAAARAAAAAIEDALEAFYSKRFAAVRQQLIGQLQQAYPDAAPQALARTVDDEAAMEAEFERRSRSRWQRDVPAILALPEAERQRRMEAFLARERRVAELRERALLSRASSRLEQVSVRLSSPLGAYWTLDPKLKTHTADCVAMAGKFWPWSVIDRIHPPRHANCGCRLWPLAEAVQRGWMRADQVPDEADAVRRANRLARDVPELRDAFLREGVDEETMVRVLVEADRFLDLAEADLHRGDRRVPALRYPKGFAKGGQFRPRDRYAPGLPTAMRRSLRRLGRPTARAHRRRGEWREVDGHRVFVPHDDNWRRTVAGRAYVSPPQSTEVYPAPPAESPGVPEPLRRAAATVRAELHSATVREMRVRESRGEPPVRAGDDRSFLAALSVLGYHRTAASFEGGQHVDSFRDDRTGRTLTVSGLDRVEKVTAGEPPAPSVSLDRPPESWDEFRSDVLGYAGDLARRHNAINGATDFREGESLGDVAGRRTWDGVTEVGPDARQVLEDAYAARRKGSLSDAQAAEAYIATQVSLHEISHAVNPEDQYDFRSPERRFLEEAVVEELSRQETAERLERQGQRDVLSWMARHPDHPYLEGNYGTSRMTLAGVLDRAGVAPEDRRAYLSRLKYDIDPNERIPTLARDAAKHNGTSEEAERATIEGLLADPGRAGPAGWYALPTLPDAAARLREQPAALSVGGRRLGAGATVRTGDREGRVTDARPASDGTWTATVDVGGATTYVRGLRPGGDGIEVLDEGRAGGAAEGDRVEWTRPDGKKTEGVVDRVLRAGERDWAAEATTDSGQRVVVTDRSTRALRALGPAADRATDPRGREGRHLFVEGSGWQFVPAGEDWRHEAQGHVYTSPAGGTDVYQDGALVSRKGSRPTVAELIPPSKRRPGEMPSHVSASVNPDVDPAELRQLSGDSATARLAAAGYAHLGANFAHRFDRDAAWTDQWVSPQGDHVVSLGWNPNSNQALDPPVDVAREDSPDPGPEARELARGLRGGSENGAREALERAGYVAQTRSGDWLLYTNPDHATSVLVRGGPSTRAGVTAAVATRARPSDAADADTVLWRTRPEQRVRPGADAGEAEQRLKQFAVGWKPTGLSVYRTGDGTVYTAAPGHVAPLPAGGGALPEGIDGYTDYRNSADGSDPRVLRVRWREHGLDPDEQAELRELTRRRLVGDTTKEADPEALRREEELRLEAKRRVVVDAGLADLGPDNGSADEPWRRSGLVDRETYDARSRARREREATASAEGRAAAVATIQRRAEAGERPLVEGETYTASLLREAGFVFERQTRSRKLGPGTFVTTLRYKPTAGKVVAHLRYKGSGFLDAATGAEGQWEVVRVTQWKKGNVGVARTALHRPPESLDEVVSDALARADEMGAHYGVPVSATHVDWGRGQGMQGVHRFDGSIGVGRAVKKAMQDLIAARKAGRPLTEDERARAYYAYNVLQHEINHAVNPHSSAQYQGAYIRLEEGLTEELSHVMVDGWLQRLGLDELREWARDHPGHRYSDGTYTGHRDEIRKLLDRAGVPDERRGALLEDLKFRKDNVHRLATLAELVARNEGRVRPAAQDESDHLSLPWGESLERTTEGMALERELERKLYVKTATSSGAWVSGSFAPILHTTRPGVGDRAAARWTAADGTPVRPGDVVARVTTVRNPGWFDGPPDAPMTLPALEVGRAVDDSSGDLGLQRFGGTSYAIGDVVAGDRVVDLLRPHDAGGEFRVAYGDRVSVPVEAVARRDRREVLNVARRPGESATPGTDYVGGRVIGWSEDGAQALVEGTVSRRKITPDEQTELAALREKFKNAGSDADLTGPEGARLSELTNKSYTRDDEHFTALVPKGDVMPAGDSVYSTSPSTGNGYVRLGDGSWVAAGAPVTVVETRRGGAETTGRWDVRGYDAQGRIEVTRPKASGSGTESLTARPEDVRPASGAWMAAPLSPGRPPGARAPASLAEVEARHPGVELSASERDGLLTLSMLRVREPDERGGGMGGAALRDVLAYADAHGLAVALTPQRPAGAGAGPGRGALTRWYRSHGFVPNTGRNKDWRTRDTLVRPPVAAESPGRPTGKWFGRAGWTGGTWGKAWVSPEGKVVSWDTGIVGEPEHGQVDPDGQLHDRGEGTDARSDRVAEMIGKGYEAVTIDPDGRLLGAYREGGPPSEHAVAALRNVFGSEVRPARPTALSPGRPGEIAKGERGYWFNALSGENRPVTVLGSTARSYRVRTDDGHEYVADKFMVSREPADVAAAPAPGRPDPTGDLLRRAPTITRSEVVDGTVPGVRYDPTLHGEGVAGRAGLGTGEVALGSGAFDSSGRLNTYLLAHEVGHRLVQAIVRDGYPPELDAFRAGEGRAEGRYAGAGRSELFGPDRKRPEEFLADAYADLLHGQGEFRYVPGVDGPDDPAEEAKARAEWEASPRTALMRLVAGAARDAGLPDRQVYRSEPVDPAAHARGDYSSGYRTVAVAPEARSPGRPHAPGPGARPWEWTPDELRTARLPHTEGGTWSWDPADVFDPQFMEGTETLHDIAHLSVPGPRPDFDLHEMLDTHVYPLDAEGVPTGHHVVRASQRTIDAVKRDAPMTVYRAVDPELADQPVLPGAYVTESLAYARGHGEGPMNGRYKIVALDGVRPSELATLRDPHEFHWAPKTPEAALERMRAWAAANHVADPSAPEAESPGAPSLTGREEAALHRWSGDSPHPIVSEYRDGVPDGPLARDFASALEKLPRVHGPLLRGLNVPGRRSPEDEAAAWQARAGEVLEGDRWATPQGATRDASSMEKLTLGPGTRLVLEIDTGRGRSLSGHTFNREAWEGEVVVPPGRYRVEGADVRDYPVTDPFAGRRQGTSERIATVRLRDVTPVPELQSPGRPTGWRADPRATLRSAFDGVALPLDDGSSVEMRVEDDGDHGVFPAYNGGWVVEGSLHDGERDVGVFRRWVSADGRTAKKDLVWIDPAYRGRGFARALDRHDEAVWRSLGVRRVLADTDEDGGYVWARLGYRLDVPRFLEEADVAGEGVTPEQAFGPDGWNVPVEIPAAPGPARDDALRRAYLWMVLSGAEHDDERTAELEHREQRPAPTPDQLRAALDAVQHGALHDVTDVAASPNGRALLSDAMWSGYREVAPDPPVAPGAAPDGDEAHSPGRPGATAAPAVRPEFLERVRGNLDPRGDTASGYGTLASKFASAHGMTQHQYEDEAQARLRELVAGADLVVRLDPKDLPTFLDAGHLMNQHEAHGSHGNFDPEWRASMESETWAIPGAPKPHPEKPGVRREFLPGRRSTRALNYAAKHPDLYPVYGYLSDAAVDTPRPSGDAAQGQYGLAKIVLRPEAKARSYVYFSDSLGDLGDGRGAPSPMDAPSTLSVPRGDPLKWTTIGPVPYEIGSGARSPGPSPYAEAQIFGGVRPGDVLRIELSDPPTPEQRAALEKAGVPWSVPGEAAYADLRQHILDGLERGEEPDAAYGEIDDSVTDDQRAELERMIDQWREAHPEAEVARSPGRPWREVDPVPGPDVGVRNDFGAPGTPFAPSETWQRMRTGRDTGHFGTGLYFVSGEGDSLRGVEGNTRGVDLTGARLWHPLSNRQAYAVHDALGDVNTLASRDAPDGLEGDGSLFGPKPIRPTTLAVTIPVRDNSLVPPGEGDLFDRKARVISQAVRETVAAQKAADAAGEPADFDSASTRVMRAFGWDGVDTRHLREDADGLSGLDNTQYGSVLYAPPWHGQDGGVAPDPEAQSPGRPAPYEPDPTAPAEGEWVREPDPSGSYPQGIATGWRQAHDALVRDALLNWKGATTDFSIHARDAHEGAPVPSSGSGKKRRAQAEALQWEIDHNGHPNPVPLYRGGEAAAEPRPWTESEQVAGGFARLYHADVHALAPGQARGIRIADYVHTGLNDIEREWIAKPASVAQSPGRPKVPTVKQAEDRVRRAEARVRELKGRGHVEATPEMERARSRLIDARQALGRARHDAMAATLGDAVAQGGATLDRATGDQPTEGFPVAREGHSSITKTEEFLRDPVGIFDRWLEENAEVFDDPSVYVGVWHDVGHGEVVLDPVDLFGPDRREEAMAAGRERDQQFIYDLVTGTEIPTGGTGGREGSG